MPRRKVRSGGKYKRNVVGNPERFTGVHAVPRSFFQACQLVSVSITFYLVDSLSG
jgi:hypothetical protein